MDRLKEKYAILEQAFKTLDEAIILYEKFFRINNAFSCQELFETQSSLLNSLQDSLIQRFEYCTDLLWKYIKEYIETNEKRLLAIASPRGVFREASIIRLISEDESEAFLAMVTDRNKTSHIYHREIADFIAKNIPTYYRLMTRVFTRLKPQD